MSLPRPIQRAPFYASLRAHYREAMREPTFGFRDGASSGFVVNFQVLAGQSGRGVHATSHIRRGELVWCKNNTAVFARGSDFYRFLELVRDNLGNDAACDTVNMAYEITSPSGSRVVHADLDEGSLLNSAMLYSRPGADESNNVNCHLPSGSRRVCTRCIYATRDIGPGQEFLDDDSAFGTETLKWFKDVAGPLGRSSTKETPQNVEVVIGLVRSGQA